MAFIGGCGLSTALRVLIVYICICYGALGSHRGPEILNNTTRPFVWMMTDFVHGGNDICLQFRIYSYNYRSIYKLVLALMSPGHSRSLLLRRTAITRRSDSTVGKAHDLATRRLGIQLSKIRGNSITNLSQVDVLLRQSPRAMRRPSYKRRVVHLALLSEQHMPPNIPDIHLTTRGGGSPVYTAATRRS
jgi:hypothetical protein